jgi:hypothetical protein
MSKISLHSRRPDMGPPPGTCQKSGCSKPVKFQVGITCYPPKRYGRHPLEGEMGLYLCADCGPLMKPEDVISDQGWRLILQGARAAGLVDPDRRLTEIRLLPVLNL